MTLRAPVSRVVSQPVSSELRRGIIKLLEIKDSDIRILTLEQ